MLNADFYSRSRKLLTYRSNAYSGRSERTNHDVIPIRITDCKFAGASIWVQFGLFIQSSDKGASPKQRFIEVVHAKEQE